MIESFRSINLTEKLLMVSVFFLPSFQVISLICWILILILEFTKSGSLVKLKSISRNPFYSLLILLYLFYLVGMLWTDNFALGLEDLQIKIPLFLFLLFNSKILNQLSNSMKQQKLASTKIFFLIVVVVVRHSRRFRFFLFVSLNFLYKYFILFASTLT